MYGDIHSATLRRQRRFKLWALGGGDNIGFTRLQHSIRRQYEDKPLGHLVHTVGVQSPGLAP